MSLIRRNGGLGTTSFFPRTSLFNDFFDTDFPSFGLNTNIQFNSDWMPAANVREGEKEYSIELSVPGYSKKDIHVAVDDNNTLRITGEREEEINEENENYTRQEFSHGSFERSFQLPETVNREKIDAKCKDGVLTLELRKKEEAIRAKKVKEIQIS